MAQISIVLIAAWASRVDALKCVAKQMTMMLVRGGLSDNLDMKNASQKSLVSWVVQEVVYFFSAPDQVHCLGAP